MSDLRSMRETNCRIRISHNQLVVPTSFSSALRTSRFNDIPSLIDFRTARLWRSGDTLMLKVPLGENEKLHSCASQRGGETRAN